MSTECQQLHRLRNSACNAWGHGLRSATRLHGTPLWHRQNRINFVSATLVNIITSHLNAAHAEETPAAA